MEALLERVVVLDEGRVRLDSDVDQARASAYQVAGTASAVDRFAVGRRLLSQHAVGVLKTAVVDGATDRTTRADAASAGVELSGVSLQQVVAALGSRDTELEGVAS
jgi:ABC-2 type transport system ATP-binding protein